LARPRFRFDPAEVHALLSDLEAIGEHVDSVPITVTLPDPDDAPFLEVAISGHADALVTGNLKHYPTGLGVPIVSPVSLLQQVAPS
jgi:predicted nucleic acid-binding protein